MACVKDDSPDVKVSLLTVEGVFSRDIRKELNGCQFICGISLSYLTKCS